MYQKNFDIRNCNVAVVGGAGFLGSHLVQHLVYDRGCHVVVIDNLVVGQRSFIEGFGDRVDFIHHDITGSEDYLHQVFGQLAVEYVFNYAAYPYIPDSFARPLQVFNVNAFGALKVINAAQEAGVKAILQVSSAEIYGSVKSISGADQRMPEWIPVEPHSTYGASKAAIDAMVQVRWKEARTPCIALRQFNCVGERDILHPYVIPEIIRQLNLQKGSMHASVNLGNDSKRDFLYAGDAVRLATELLEYGQFGEVYNLGSQEAIGIYALARLIGKIMGFERIDVITEESRKRPWEIWHLQSDNTKIYQTIPSRAVTTLEEALRLTIDDLEYRQPLY